MTGSEGKFRAALVQLRCGRTIQPNLDAAEAAIRQAADGGADIVFTPENTNLMELDTEKLFAAVQPQDGNPALERLSALAGELGLWLHVGSMSIRVGADRIANRSFLVGPDGGIRARYDKIHMFDVDLPGGESYRESKIYRPGSEAVVADLPWCRLGFTTCYDLRFPALYRTLAQAGAHLITVPAAFTKVTGEAHWHVLLRARAIETGSFIVAAAQGGMHEVGRATYGHSLVVAPWGEIVAEAGVDPTVIYATIDPAKVGEARARIPSLQHDRPFALSEPGTQAQVRKVS